MRFVQRMTGALTALALILSYTAVSADNMDFEEEVIFEVSLMDAGDMPYDNPFVVTPEEAELLEYVVNEISVNHSETIPVPESMSVSAQRFAEISYPLIWLIQYEHPEIYFIKQEHTAEGQNFLITCMVDGSTHMITSVNLEYSMTDEEIAETDKKIEAAILKIVSNTLPSMTDVQKALAVHDYILANYQYDSRLYDSDLDVRLEANRTIDKMVADKRGVCQGYSYLFKMAMERLGIECVTVPSDAHDHMWNKVKVDGEWYNIDLTYDDPLSDATMHKQRYPFSSNVYASHEFFLLNDDEIRAADQNQHSTWNAYKWNGEPAEASYATEYSGSVIHDINGVTVNKDGHFFCMNVSEYTDGIRDARHSVERNAIYEIMFEENTLEERYSESRDYKWYLFGDEERHYYGSKFSTLALYNGKIYFNSPNSVYCFDDENYTAELIWQYDGGDVSNTYLYGMTVVDGKLYSEYSTNPIFIDALLAPELPKEYEPEVPLFEEPPCRTQMVLTNAPNEETGESELAVEVTVDIPSAVYEALADENGVVEEEKMPKVIVAQYDRDGVFIGFTDIEVTENSAAGTVAVDAECSSVKAFVWSNLFMLPLSETNALDLTNGI